MKLATFIVIALFPLGVLAQNPPAKMPDMGDLFLQQMDGNGDGKVTMEEFSKPVEMKFRAMDYDHDGVITADEARKFARMMMQRMQQMQRSMQQQRSMPR